ncbi:hypothetical protein N0V94_002433 [Neodidymelliopsis sp. IMI 364377]|nr:hypothetical protein N0V94_002433 [Neodidymelliopsis sp. IMI 364377]
MANMQTPERERTKRVKVHRSKETSYTNDAVPQHTNNDFDELCFDFEANPPTFDDAAQPAQEFGTDLNVDEDEFDNDLVDEDLLEMLDNAVDTLDSPNFQPGSPSEAIDVEKPSHTAASPDLSSDNLTASDDGMNSSGFASRKFVSPVMAKTRLLAAIGDEDRKPIVRPDFPCSVRDRSPIIGLSATTLLRTCFRIGEAVSQSCHAVKIGNNVLIELYARVLNSERDDKQQRFTLCDLFHTKPPYLEALYASTIWKPVELFDYDSARLLQQGKICRCIGTMKRDGKNWIMTVLNVWEATWDDVAWVEGIINS